MESGPPYFVTIVLSFAAFNFILLSGIAEHGNTDYRGCCVGALLVESGFVDML